MNIRFASLDLVLDGRCCIFHPESETLLFADLHLEKGRYLQTQHHPLPAFDSMDTLDRLEQCLQNYHAKSVVCLGDSFHTEVAAEHMPLSLQQRLIKAVKAVDRWVWVVGNHDPSMPGWLPGEVTHTFFLHDVALQHEASENARPEIIGHYHPKTVMTIKRQTVRGKCFLMSKNRLVMPSFGTFTGGLDADDNAFNRVFRKQAKQKIFIYNHKLFPLKK